MSSIFPPPTALLLGLWVLALAPGLDQPHPKPGSTESRHQPAITFQASPGEEGFGTVAVTGLPETALAHLGDRRLHRSQWLAVLAIRTSAAARAADELPAVLGHHSIAGKALRFTPRFPFKPGLTYYARFDGGTFDRLAGRPAGATPSAELTFTPPLPDGGSSTRVEAVYPTATDLPANLLRLYIHFSAPMRAKNVHHSIHLYDSSGREVKLPFVEIEHGLWDPAHRRLTLFFHPGRIKRGVAPNLELGPPLREGGSYRLVVEPELEDARGYPMVASFEKEIRVIAADRASPSLQHWRLSPPTARDAPLVLDFPEPLDHALLQRFILVEDARGKSVSGEIEVTRNETRWSLAPDLPWEPGHYTVRVSSLLEDLAGNTFDHLFDEDLFGRSGETTATPRWIELSFSIP